MSTQRNVALVKAAYAAFSAGDVQKVLGLLTPDVVWEFPDSKFIPWAGTFRGPSEVAKFFAALKEHSAIEAYELQSLVASADLVLVLGRERVRIKLTGATYACAWVNAVTVRDGRIAAFREYTDTAVIANAFGSG